MRQQYFLPYQHHRAGWCQEWANAGFCCWNETSCYWPGYNCGEWRWTEKIQLKPDSWSAGDSRLCVPGFSVFLSKLGNLVLFTYCPIAYWHLLVRMIHTILHILHDATWILGKQVIASQLVLADCRILPRCPLGWHLRSRSKMGQQFEACNNTIACCLYMRWIKNPQAPHFLVGWIVSAPRLAHSPFSLIWYDMIHMVRHPIATGRQTCAFNQLHHWHRLQLRHPCSYCCRQVWCSEVFCNPWRPWHFAKAPAGWTLAKSGRGGETGRYEQGDSMKRGALVKFGLRYHLAWKVSENKI
jgi:hypothetical protein